MPLETDLFARAEQAAQEPRVVAAALRSFYALADRWQLSVSDGARLLGGIPHRTYLAWRKTPPERIPPDCMLRMWYVNHVALLLERLFAGAPEVANGWMQRPNMNPLFSGRPPIAFVLGGGPLALDQLYGWLHSAIGGGGSVLVKSSPTAFSTTP